MSGSEDEQQGAEPDLTPLNEPREGIPDPIVDERALASAARALAAAEGPVALDTERASGYRYYPRAYLVQVRREGAGTFLFDPVSVPDLSAVAAATQDAEWVLHAASQDLPALHEVGLTPTRLFDTELAARLAAQPRVGLGPLVANLMGIQLKKGHGAADWSTRPLPRAWLSYAALDVELLIDLRDILERQLAEAGKLSWAYEEFAEVQAAALRPPKPRVDPWRRTSRINTVSGARRLAVVRSLWEARDELARRTDTAPGRVLPDAALVAAAKAMPQSVQELRTVSGFRSRNQRRQIDHWWAAISRAYALPDSDLPRRGPRPDGPPPTNRWSRSDPDSVDRLAAARAAVAEVAEQVNVPVENTLPPDAVKRLAWRPPETLTEGAVAEALSSAGARQWQVGLTAAALSEALTEAVDTLDGGGSA